MLALGRAAGPLIVAANVSGAAALAGSIGWGRWRGPPGAAGDDGRRSIRGGGLRGPYGDPVVRSFDGRVPGEGTDDDRIVPPNRLAIEAFAGLGTGSSRRARPPHGDRVRRGDSGLWGAALVVGAGLVGRGSGPFGLVERPLAPDVDLTGLYRRPRRPGFDGAQGLRSLSARHAGGCALGSPGRCYPANMAQLHDGRPRTRPPQPARRASADRPRRTPPPARPDPGPRSSTLRTQLDQDGRRTTVRRLATVEKAFDSRRRGPRRPAPRIGRAVRHPPDRGRADRRRPRDRPIAVVARAPPRRPGGHRVQPRRRRGALRPRSRASSTASRSCRSSAPTPTSSSRPRTSGRCSWRWPRTSGSSSSSSPTGSTTCARWPPCRPRSSSGSPARRWRSTPRWPSGSGSGRSSGSSRTSPSRRSSRTPSASSPSSSTRAARAASRTSTGRSRRSAPELAKAGIEAELQGPPEAHLQHPQEDAAQGRRVRRDLRRLRDPRPRRRRQGLLRGARRRPFAVAADPRPVRRLHRGPQEQPLPEPPHGGHRPRRQAARDPDPDPRRCTR